MHQELPRGVVEATASMRASVVPDLQRLTATQRQRRHRLPIDLDRQSHEDAFWHVRRLD